MNNFLLRKKDIGEAIKRAREDERKKCDAEKEQALNLQLKDTEGRYYLMMVEKQGQIHSLEMRIAKMERELRDIKEREQTIKEVHLQQKQTAIDMVYLIQKWHEKQTDDLQEVLSIKQRIENASGKYKLLPAGVQG